MKYVDFVKYSSSNVCDFWFDPFHNSIMKFDYTSQCLILIVFLIGIA